ncbi:hypothetical protein Taro_027815 [Colocasia esculenta]|uniref:Uncharacterized protein n=1 Tax=Colocasia esculenta TaxID=4460 RepID=A0A843V9N3_COLES|nr:hypothetical protein [Colocasia esculenta]
MSGMDLQLCVCRAAVGPFVRDCETERLFLCCVVRVGYWPDQSVVHSRVVASFFSDSCLASGCGFCVVTCWLRFSSMSLELDDVSMPWFDFWYCL